LCCRASAFLEHDLFEKPGRRPAAEAQGTSFSQLMLSSLIIADKFRPNVQGTTQILLEELRPVRASKTWCEYPYHAR
jgi:hypothetical protein